MLNGIVRGAEVEWQGQVFPELDDVNISERRGGNKDAGIGYQDC